MNCAQNVASAGALMLTAVLTGCMGKQTPDGPQPTPADYTTAAIAEVRDAQGQVVLRGTFAVSPEDDDDVERKAPLAPTAIDPDAAGEAEVEISGSGNDRKQEVEFAVRNVQPGAVFTFVIDGKTFGSATADGKGRASLERDVPLLAR